MSRQGDVLRRTGRGGVTNLPDHVLVLSRDSRNRQGIGVLAAPVVTTNMAVPDAPTIVELSDAEPVRGAAMIDLMFLLSERSLSAYGSLGPVSAGTLEAAKGAIRIAFALG